MPSHKKQSVSERALPQETVTPQERGITFVEFALFPWMGRIGSSWVELRGTTIVEFVLS